MKDNQTKMRIALKLGGSVITDKSKPYTVRRANIVRLVREVKAALDKEPALCLIVGNGGGSFPHQAAKKGELKGGIKDAWQIEHLVETHRSALELNKILLDEMVKQGVPAFSIKPSSIGVSKGGKITEMETKQVEHLFDMRMVPMVYGDVFIDIKQGCSIQSTENIFLYLGKKHDLDKIIIGTDVDGVLDGNGNLINEINPSNYDEMISSIGGAETTDVTGGMRHKVESMFELAKVVKEIRIVNAAKEGIVQKALLGEPFGTKITNR